LYGIDVQVIRPWKGELVETKMDRKCFEEEEHEPGL
jgi:hypothetical protein